MIQFWSHHRTKSSAVAKRPCHCCVGQCWLRYNWKRIFCTEPLWHNLLLIYRIQWNNINKRSSVPIESPYVTSYYRLIVTYVLPRTVSKLSQIIPILDGKPPLGIFDLLLGLEATYAVHFKYKGLSPTNHSSCQKTGWMDLLYGVIILAVDYFVLSQCTHLTDNGETDRKATASPCVALAVARWKANDGTIILGISNTAAKMLQTISVS